MDEILDFIPGGPWLLGACALLTIPGGRRRLRPFAQASLKAGIGVLDQAKSLTAGAREQATGLYAKAKADRPARRTARRRPQRSPKAE